VPEINKKIKTLLFCCGLIWLCLWLFKPTEPPVAPVTSEPEPTILEEQLLVTTPVVTTELTVVADETETFDLDQVENGLPQALNEAEELIPLEETPELDEIDPQEQVSLLKVDINYMIEQWQEAWQTGDTDRYLSFYSDQFSPSSGLTLAAWRQQRQERVSTDNPITLELSEFEVVLAEDNKKATVSFDQIYQSSDFQEQSRKELVLLKDEEWRIVAERELN